MCFCVIVQILKECTSNKIYFFLVIGSTSPATQGPRFVQEPPRYRLDFSNTTGAVLPCVAQGSPAPSVQWLTAGGASATDVPGLRHVRPDGSLVFLPFRAEEYRPDVHDAAYRCAATNEVGTVLSREIRVRGGKTVFFFFRSIDFPAIGKCATSYLQSDRGRICLCVSSLQMGFERDILVS